MGQEKGDILNYFLRMRYDCGINVEALYQCLQRKRTTHPGRCKHHIQGENYFFEEDERQITTFMTPSIKGESETNCYF